MLPLAIFYSPQQLRYHASLLENIMQAYSLIEIGVKIDVFKLFLSKSIVNAENKVFWTPIFGTIPL